MNMIIIKLFSYFSNDLCKEAYTVIYIDVTSYKIEITVKELNSYQMNECGWFKIFLSNYFLTIATLAFNEQYYYATFVHMNMHIDTCSSI